MFRKWDCEADWTARIDAMIDDKNDNNNNIEWIKSQHKIIITFWRLCEYRTNYFLFSIFVLGQRWIFHTDKQFNIVFLPFRFAFVSRLFWSLRELRCSFAARRIFLSVCDLCENVNGSCVFLRSACSFVPHNASAVSIRSDSAIPSVSLSSLFPECFSLWFFSSLNRIDVSRALHDFLTVPRNSGDVSIRQSKSPIERIEKVRDDHRSLCVLF